MKMTTIRLFLLLALFVTLAWWADAASADTPTPEPTVTSAPTATPDYPISSPSVGDGGSIFYGFQINLPIIWNRGVGIVFAVWVAMLVWVIFKFISGVITAVLGG